MWLLQVKIEHKGLLWYHFPDAFHVFEKEKKWIINSILEYLDETDVDTLVVVGVETLDEVDADEDVE